MRPAPTTMALMPSAFPSSERAKASVTRADEFPNMNAAPMPCAMRPAKQYLGVRRQRTEDRCGGEARTSQSERSRPTESVGDAARVEHEHGQHKRVANDDPHHRE